MAVLLLETLTNNNNWNNYEKTKYCKFVSLQHLIEGESKVRENLKVFQVLLHEVTGRKCLRLVTSMGCA